MSQSAKEQGVSPRTVTRLRQTYCEQTTISPETSARLQASYDKALAERAELVLANLDTPPGSPPRSQDSPVGLRGYADGELKTPVRKGRVLFPEEPEPEAEAVAPDPQLCVAGGSSGASSAEEAA
eukprot:COSAG01_NODE_15401_length_1342_cov_1.381335_2_plen_125_part_00